MTTAARGSPLPPMSWSRPLTSQFQPPTLLPQPAMSQSLPHRSRPLSPVLAQSIHDHHRRLTGHGVLLWFLVLAPPHTPQPVHSEAVVNPLQPITDLDAARRPPPAGWGRTRFNFASIPQPANGYLLPSTALCCGPCRNSWGPRCSPPSLAEAPIAPASTAE